jgi:riboflavin kinase/FMN adenylyltransferase
MLLLHSFDEVTRPDPTVCSVGTFDGVHLGHQQLIRAMVNDAHGRGIASIVVTFFPHPRVVLGRAPAKYLTLPEAKAEQMAALGVDVMIVLDFTPETVRTPAAQFIGWMVDRLALRSLWIGPDFALGYRRQGDAAYLVEQGRRHGFEVNVLPELSMGASAISSTRIRDALAHGDVRDANLCLGRPFRVRGWYDGTRALCVDERQWLPAPGAYPALIEGRVNQATLSLDSPQAIVLEQPLRDGAREVIVEFV